jgi:hypothetical protein
MKKRFEKIEMPRPSAGGVRKAIKRFQQHEDAMKAESALEKLFQHTYRQNAGLDEVAVKVCTLNRLYNTNIYESLLRVAEHIVALNIDKPLEENDESIVNKLACIRFNGKAKNYFSFATKYCSFHKPLAYPIYDLNVQTALMYFREKHAGFAFRGAGLRDFPEFKKIIIDSQNTYGLTGFSFKEIDHYLWYSGSDILEQKANLKKLEGE